MTKVSEMSRNSKAKSKKTKANFKFIQGESVTIGLDVHKKSFSVALWGSKSGFIKSYQMDADGEALTGMLESLPVEVSCVIYEAGPTGYWLGRLLQQRKFRVCVAVPGSIPRSSTKETKTDRIDSIRLAEYAFKDLLMYTPVLDESTDAERSLIRLRETIMRKLVKVKVQIKSFLLYNGIQQPAGLKTWSKASLIELAEMELPELLRFGLTIFLKMLTDLQATMQETLARILRLETSTYYGKVSKRLRGIPGIGTLTSMTVLKSVAVSQRWVICSSRSARASESRSSSRSE